MSNLLLSGVVAGLVVAAVVGAYLIGRAIERAASRDERHVLKTELQACRMTLRAHGLLSDPE